MSCQRVSKALDPSILVLRWLASEASPCLSLWDPPEADFDIRDPTFDATVFDMVEKAIAGKMAEIVVAVVAELYGSTAADNLRINV